MNNISTFLIAATSSGSGKTTMTLGLLRALRNRGLATQPFKCGPDYIDIKYHNKASGGQSVNLDLFLSSKEHVKAIYGSNALQKNVAVTEGVMGLFDGYDKMNGSSAQIAELLDIPIILVINAKSMAYSAAAMIYGFKNFYPHINVVGVIFNFVGSESHYAFLKEACIDAGVEALGYLPKQSEFEIPSRHLGLTLDDAFSFDEFIDGIALSIEKHIDIDRLLAITKKTVANNNYVEEKKPSDRKMRISVAYDDALNFVYKENIEYLKRIGDVRFFSPLKNRELPESDFVYLPGGYPELYLQQLSANKTMIDSISQYINNGGRLLAECGGMMYLSAAITDEEGKDYPMVGIFDQKVTMENMKLTLGYRRFEYNGIALKGHEFHYSKIIGNEKSVAQQYNAKGREVDTKLFRYKNAIAGYTHLYWAEEERLMDLFN